MTEQIKRTKKLTKDGFKDSYLKNEVPVIISSGLNWKAFEWTLDYFKEFLPNKQVKLSAIHTISINNVPDFKKTFIQDISLRKAIELIQQNKNPQVKYYLLQQEVYKDFPELANDFDKPIWRADNPRQSKGEVVNLWIGQSGNATPLHFDMSHNFLVQIYGEKHIRLFSPSDTKYLYRNTPYTGEFHLSQIPDIDNVDEEKFPEFKYASVYEGVIKPGETLFIPAGWWHDVRSLSHSISINFWWRPKLNEHFALQFLENRMYEFYEARKFNEIGNLFSNLEELNNNLKSIKYFIDNSNNWMAVLLMANYFATGLKAVAFFLKLPVPLTNRQEDIEYVNQLVLSKKESLGIKKDDLSNLLALISKARSEQNDLFQKNELMYMYNQIQTFSEKIKFKLCSLEAS